MVPVPPAQVSSGTDPSASQVNSSTAQSQLPGPPVVLLQPPASRLGSEPQAAPFLSVQGWPAPSHSAASYSLGESYVVR